MTEFASVRDPLLSQSPSTSNGIGSAQVSSLERKRSDSRSRQRKDSLVSSDGSGHLYMNDSNATLQKSGINGGTHSNGGHLTQSGSKYDEMEEEDDDDIVAIAGEESVLRNNDNDQGYSQINGSQMSPGQGKSDMMRRILVILALIGSWFFFSTLMNLYNSWLFSNKRHNFSYPLITTSMHMFVQFGLSSLLMGVCHRNRKIVPRRPNGKRAGPKPRDYLTKVVPCALATALDIGLSNLSLKTITLTFYTMCKSSNLAFVLLFAFLFKLEKLRWSLIGIITLITIGVIMMVAAETQFVLTGAIQVLTASAMGGLRWALTQMLLHKENMGMNNPIATIFWLSPLMGLFMLLSSVVLEDWWSMFSSAFFKDAPSTLKTLFLMIAPGIIAFMMNLSEFALIQRTSVMTLSVAGIFKEIATILLSSNVFGDELTPINVTGLCIALTGIAMYNYLKYTLLIRNNNNLLQQGQGQGHRRLQDEEERCTEMGGTVLPSLARDGSRSQSRLGDFDDSASLSQEDSHGQIQLTSEEMDKRKKREEEADMAGWHTSGITRTGDGYDDGDSNHTD